MTGEPEKVGDVSVARVVPHGPESSLWHIFIAVVLSEDPKVGADAWGATIARLVDGTPPEKVVDLMLAAPNLEECDRASLTYFTKEVQAFVAQHREARAAAEARRG
ncbi:MAG: hypothetical protein KBD62_35120 [Kofleriaceae bacterium]|nr:hypothetical protein [Kofleriaceae bacterium]